MRAKLQTLSVTTLKELAKAQNIKVSGLKKSEIIDKLCEASDAKALEAAVTVEDDTASKKKTEPDKSDAADERDNKEQEPRRRVTVSSRMNNPEQPVARRTSALNNSATPVKPARTVRREEYDIPSYNEPESYDMDDRDYDVRDNRSRTQSYDTQDMRSIRQQEYDDRDYREDNLFFVNV